ncbi:MAG: hypothetical protein ABI430_00005 [Candidatus Taylorbacteria bacterium]
MRYTELLENLTDSIFSIQDLRIMGQKVIPAQFTSLAKSKQIIRLKNGLYAIANKKNELTQENISFRLYQPSYLSLEWALHYHGLIPEIVYTPTSITTRNTRQIKNDFGLFVYRHIKKELFWGYTIQETGARMFLLAEPEKALLDYIYFNLAKIQSADDIEGLRLNPITLNSLNKEKLAKYAKIFDNKRITKIVESLMK